MMDQIRDALKNINFEIVGEYLGRLNQRERYIVLGSALAGAVLLVLIILGSAMGGLGRKERKITMLKDELRRINTIRGNFSEIEREIQRLEGIIRRTGNAFSITTHLESLAQETGVKITSLNEKTSPPNDLYKERQVEANLRQIYLRNLIDFLYKIENSRQLLRIKSLQIKPNYSNPLYLNVVFSVSTFEPVE